MPSGKARGLVPPAKSTGRIPQAVKDSVDARAREEHAAWTPNTVRAIDAYRREYDAGLSKLAKGWVNVCEAMVRGATAKEDPNPLCARWVRDTLFGPPSRRFEVDRTEQKHVEIVVRQGPAAPLAHALQQQAPHFLAAGEVQEAVAGVAEARVDEAEWSVVQDQDQDQQDQE